MLEKWPTEKNWVPYVEKKDPICIYVENNWKPKN